MHSESNIFFKNCYKILIFNPYYRFRKMGAIMTRDGSLLPNDYDYSRLLHIFTNESS